MKWLRLIGLTMVLLLAVAACGSDDDGGDTTTSQAPAATTTTAAPAGTDTTQPPPEAEKVSVAILLPCAINDLSWCQAAFEGVKDLEADGLIDLQVVGDAPFDAQGAIRVMSGFAEEGVDLVIGHSFDYGAPIQEIAADFPDVNFAWQGSCAGFCIEGGPNITDYNMPMHEPAYLSGILGGGISQSGIIGANAGFDIPVCRAVMEAFLIGAQEVNPSATRLDAFLGSWVDVALAKEATSAQADQGADVFVACGNAGSFGMIQEADERGLSAFGYVYDESEISPDSVVASMAWQIGKTYKKMVDDIAAGTFQEFYDTPMSEGGFEVQFNPDYSAGSIPAEALALFEERLAEVEAGTFEVPFIGAAPE